MFLSGKILAKFFEEVYFRCILACLLRKMGEKGGEVQPNDIAHFYDALLAFFFLEDEGLIGLVGLPVCIIQENLAL